MSKIDIGKKEVDRIKYFAHNYFMEGNFRNVDPNDVQVVCILEGLYNYLKSEGQDPEWLLKKSK